MARSKAFEENEVLEKAMRLFWEQGYEKTSMSDLVEHMGIHRRSLYDTFGDKHQLFIKAVDRFGEHTARSLKAGLERAQTATEALQFVFDFTICREEGVPSGCLFVNAAVELALREQEVDALTLAGFTDTEQMLKAVIVRGQQTGEFTTRFTADELAECLHQQLLGLRVMARTSTPVEKLNRTARVFLEMLLPPLQQREI